MVSFRFQIMVSLSDDSLKRNMEILSILATMLLISIVLSIFLSFILEADLTTTLYYRSASSDDKKDHILSVNRSMMTLSRLGGNIRSKMTGQVLASIFKSFELKSEKYLPETQKKVFSSFYVFAFNIFQVVWVTNADGGFGEALAVGYL